MVNRLDAERDRARVLQAVFDNDKKTGGGRYLNADKIAELLGLDGDDAVYHLQLLKGQGYVNLVEAMGGPEGVGALMTPAGQRFVREGVANAAPVGINIGNFVNNMLGGTAMGVGLAQSSEVSQAVSDPAMLREALNTLGAQLLEAVKGQLSGGDLESYARAVDEFKEEVEGPRHSGRLRALLNTLSLFGDVQGTLELAARVQPFVAVAVKLAQAAGAG
jgi:hypothetical protein